ncbi:hypothetical protein [Streptomyces sp. NPDC056165]|uniref:hypothetical protein n=1 Tax=Streptomyces sp. NPDC056165 TaxID=3345733 RepID=UPI0035DB6F90
MGESLSAVNLAPREVGTAATLKLAVGTPGEAIGTAAEAGAIHTFDESADDHQLGERLSW